MNKEIVYITIKNEINDRVDELQKAFNNQKESLKTASESTAGDKHNTSRAMMHIEEEKLGKQLAQLLQLKKLITKVSPSVFSETITLGSLVETNQGWLYLAVPLGKVNISNIDLMAISLASPIGQALQGKKIGESVKFNGKSWEIKNLL